MSRIKAFVVLGVVTALAATLGPATTASANHGAALSVEVGHFFSEPGDPPAETMAFLPEDITVHKGDTIKFFGEFHTATVLPTSVSDVDAWFAEEATAPDDPYAAIKLNPDNTTYPLKLFGDNPFYPRTDCGASDDPCTYIGDEVVDSGLLLSYFDFSGGPTVPPPNNGWSVTVDANPGDVFWVVCRLHPHMRMRIAVVNPNEDSTDQTEIDTAAQASITEDRRAASELHESLLATHSKRKVGGKNVWRAYGGFDTDRLALYDFYPRRVTLRKGDKVQWRFSALNHEVHTVTLSGKKAIKLANVSQPLLCDPNGDGESGGETDAGFPPACDPGVHEALLGARMIEAEGDGIVKSGKDLENSGIRGPLTGNVDPYVVKFVKGGSKYVYLCLIHPFMKATVKVR